VSFDAQQRHVRVRLQVFAKLVQHVGSGARLAEYSPSRLENDVAWDAQVVAVADHAVGGRGSSRSVFRRWAVAADGSGNPGLSAGLLTRLAGRIRPLSLGDRLGVERDSNAS
jgi:hypothetical protein